MKAHRVLQPNITVSRDNSGHTLFKRANGIGADGFDFADINQLLNQSQTLRIVITPKRIMETIEGLRVIAEERPDHSIGFHSLPLDEDDANLGRKATQLANYLSKTKFHRLDPDKVVEAFAVVETYGFINILEEITKGRGNYFGFKDTRTQRDKEVADKANNLAVELKQNQYEETVLEAMEFIQLVAEEEMRKNSGTHHSRRIISDFSDDEPFSIN